jgi:microcystin-dependent protein
MMAYPHNDKGALTMTALFTRSAIVLALAGMLCAAPLPSVDAAGDYDMLGSIALFAGNYPPRNWALCDGSVLPISQNCALYSLLGNIYGGDGRTTFALPDLRGRVPLHFGAGPGLSKNYRLGESGGAETVTLASGQVRLPVTTAAIDDSLLDSDSAAELVVADPPAVPGDRAVQLGGSEAHANLQPYMALNYIICVQGYYPARD